MIEILKKRFKIGDEITIRTSEATLIGVIDDFEESCIILISPEGNVELIANDAIKGVSAPRRDSVESIIKNETEIEKIETVLEPRKDIIQETGLTENKTSGKIIVRKLGSIDSKKIKNPKTKDKPDYRLSSFADLRQLILPEIEAENKKTVPANGMINTFFESRNFGFIGNKLSDIWFSYDCILDDELRKSLRGENRFSNIPVLFNTKQTSKGNVAVNIQKPKSVEKILEVSKNYLTSNEFDKALGLISQVLESFPDNYDAKNLRENIENQRKIYKPQNKGWSTTKYSTQYFPNFQKATKAKNIDKNFPESLRLFFIALENNEKRESCIKDIAMLYVAMGEADKALEFNQKYEAELPSNTTTYNHLQNFYRSIRKFNRVIEFTEKLLNETDNRDKKKQAELLLTKGFSLIQLGKLDDARKILEKTLKVYPENSSANRLLEALDNPNDEELNQIIADAEFTSLGGGFSKFIKDTLDNYDEYHGVPPTTIDSGNFTNETLNAIRKLVDTAGRARPRERANYLLTEAKLMQSLEPDKDNILRSVLARYCNAMALNHISENSSMDVIRNNYLEAFSLEEKYKFTVTQVALYLISYKSSYSELLSTKTPSIEEALKYVLDGDYKEQIWEGILSMFLWNRSISAQIIGKLYENETFRAKSVKFLQGISLDTSESSSIDDYTNLWNQAREKRQRDYSRWFASIKAIYANENVETLANQLYDSLTEARKNWLSQLDILRLNTISTNISDELNQYLRQTGYRDKERFFGFVKAQVNGLISEIKEKPTKFSYEGFIPLLGKINLLLDKSFKTIEDSSTPKVKVIILSKDCVVSNENVVPFQITVENSKDSSPIRDIKISVNNSEEISFIEGNNEYYDSVDGGENCIIKLSVKVSEKVKQDKATTLDVICSYKTRNEETPVSVQEQLSLRLYSEEEFETIENPYAPIADGGPVENKKMFFGRDEFINNRITAILSADSKQIIIYGQKRSGKSSVLYHLKRGLEETNQTFCISFSLGLIIKNLDEFTLYHKILSTIERELKLRRAKKEIVPNFICPSLDDFRTKYSSNPANGFIEIIEDFKIASLEVDGWSDKKLIVMIDEFTYLYTAIRNGTTSDTIMKQWKAVTQSENAKFSVVLVGQDVVPIFMKEDYAKNASGVIEPIRLTYLEETDARRLIEEPILDKNQNSRFIGSAVDTIMAYTSRNPYYIQIFCARLVDYMNAKKVIRVTEADIKEVAETFIEGSQALAPEKFDNLIRAGEEHDFKEFDDEPIFKILRQIANGSKNIGICSRDNISINDKVLEDKILNHLKDREVLERKQGDNYKIQVKLFQEWLLRH